MQRYMGDIRISAGDGLIKEVAVAHTRAYMSDFVEELVAGGVDLLDVPQLFWVFDRLGRAEGTLWRKSVPRYDHFSPYCTRPFVEAAFALKPLQLYSRPLHYQLTYVLSPKLHAKPFDTGSWSSQRTWAIWLKGICSLLWGQLPRALRQGLSRVRAPRPERLQPAFEAFEHQATIEAKRQEIREICLDRPASPLWELVDRERFERITSEATDPNERLAYALKLYLILTLFMYETA